MSEFLSYRETRQLLADKLNATQESMAYEIAAWVWLRNLVAYQNSEELVDDGLVVGDRVRFYFDAKGLETQCFDYFPKLERLILAVRLLNRNTHTMATKPLTSNPNDCGSGTA